MNNTRIKTDCILFFLTESLQTVLVLAALSEGMFQENLYSSIQSAADKGVAWHPGWFYGTHGCGLFLSMRGTRRGERYSNRRDTAKRGIILQSRRAKTRTATNRKTLRANATTTQQIEMMTFRSGLVDQPARYI